ncbi:MAG: hypothetical protein EBS68_10535 [Rhodobacteraceae bacterium]|nr:hypothetical protein [Paracoccaceae bacterium]
MKPPIKNSTHEIREFIDHALQKTGLTLEQLSERLDYKSLARVRAGEFTLPEAKRRHISDLVKLHERNVPPMIREEPGIYGSGEKNVPSDLAQTLITLLESFHTVPPAFQKAALDHITTTFAEWKNEVVKGKE